jgi:signal transduction histidine kinase
MSLGLLIASISNITLLAVIIAQYINEHKRANLYLAEIDKQKIDSINEKFVRIFDVSPALMAIYREKDFVYVAVNDAWSDCLGFRWTEVIGPSEEELNTAVVAENRISIGGLALGKSEECQVRTKQGEIRDWLVSKAQLRFDGEECILVTSIDKTILKQLEKEIGRLDRLNLIGEMAASIGHEVRNPLTTVRGFLQLFQRRNHYSSDKDNIDLMIAELEKDG